jgi:hypothetical protein
MKKKLLVILTLTIIILTACSTLKKYVQYSALVDFSVYSDKGMLMTTGDFSSTYKPIGIIESTCYDGYILKEGIRKKQPNPETELRDDLYSPAQSGDRLKDYNFKKCTLNELLDKMYADAKGKGANGIIKIDIQSTSFNEQPGIRIIGMAIKY